MSATAFQRMRREQAKTNNTEMKEDTQRAEILKGKTRVADIEKKEDDDMAKFSKAADRSTRPEAPKVEEPAKDEVVTTQEEKAPAEGPEDYKTYSKSKLESIKNDDLKAYLDSKGIKYGDDAEKKDLIALILGE